MPGKNKKRKVKTISGDSRLCEGKDGKLMCLLCPHSCVLKEGESGKCLVRKSDGEKIYLDAYGHLTNIAVEPIEKKPITHFLPGTKTLSIGSFGCSLFCKFCENSHISQITGFEDSSIFTPNEVIKLSIEKECASVCMTYNEPIIQYEYLLDLAEECHKNNLKFVIKTNAFVNKEPWKKICQVVDAVNVDFKGHERAYKEICGVSQYVIKERLEEAVKSGVHLEISVPVYNDQLQSMNKVAQRIASVCLMQKRDAPVIPVHLLRIFPANKWEGVSATSQETIESARQIFHSCGIENPTIHI